MGTRGIDATVGYDWSPANKRSESPADGRRSLNEPLPRSSNTSSTAAADPTISSSWVSAPESISE
jgi:hypothetical protein